MSGEAPTWLLVAAMAGMGALAGAWAAGVAERLPDLRAPLFRWGLGRSAGAVRTVERAILARAGMAAAAGSVRAWVVAAEALGVMVGVAAATLVEEPHRALLVALIGWVALAIAVADARTLTIPTALWVAGAVLAAAGCALTGGGSFLAGRALLACGVVAAFRLCAVLARWMAGEVPVGEADAGVLAFLSLAFGAWFTVQILVGAGVFALAYLALRVRRGPWATPGVLCVAVAGALGTAPIAAASAAVLLTAIIPAARRGTGPGAAPFGACLVASALLLVVFGVVLGGEPGRAMQSDPLLLRTFWS